MGRRADAIRSGAAKAGSTRDRPGRVEHVIDRAGDGPLDILQFGERQLGKRAAQCLCALDDLSRRMMRASAIFR